MGQANLLFKTIICVLIILSAPWVALFFERPSLTNAIRLSAIILPLQALKSPIYILLKRQLKFAPLFWSSLAERFLAVPVLIALAISLQSYWAFIITDISAAVFSVSISYFIAKKRPSFSITGFSNQWTFSKWMLAKSIVGYARSQIDTVVVSKAFSAAVLGSYHMSRELAMMPAHFVLGPAIDPLLSAFKNDKNNKSELLNNVAFTLVVVLIISIPLCAYFWVFSTQLVLLMFGEGWQEAGALLSTLSFLFLYWSLLHVVETAFVAQSQVRLIFIFDIFSLCFIAGTLIAGVSLSLSVYEIAGLRVITGLMASILLLLYLFKGYMRQLYNVLWISIGVSLISFLWIKLIKLQTDYSAVFHPLVDLIISGLELTSIVFISLFLMGLATKHYHLLRLIKISEAILLKLISFLYRKIKS